MQTLRQNQGDRQQICSEAKTLLSASAPQGQLHFVGIYISLFILSVVSEAVAAGFNYSLH